MEESGDEDDGRDLKECGEGELVGGVHTLVGGVVQVYHVPPELEEEDKGHVEVQEIERESQVEEKRSDDHGWRWSERTQTT